VKPTPLVAGILLGFAAAPVLAQEHVQLEVQGKDTVLGTIRPADEREAIIGNLVAGTVLKAAAKSTQKTGPVPSLQLLLDGTPVGAAQVVVKGRGATLAPYVVPTSGNYKVVVAGDASLDGDYQLAVNWTPRKTFSATGTSAGDTTFTFSVPANSGVTVTLTAAKGSPFVPHLVELVGPTGTLALAGGGKASGLVLAQRGDWTLHFQSDGADGAYKVTVKVAPPKVAKHKADIRDKVLNGAFGGGSNLYGSVVTPDEGGTVEVNGSGSSIDGSSVTIPPDSLGQTTSIFVAAATPYTPPGDNHPAGPAVEFGPSGTQFDPDKPATVTIPFDAALFGGDTSALTVFVKDSEGVISPVLPTSSYVFGANTVTFTTSHFSTFQAATSGPRGYPNSNYVYIEISSTPYMAFDGEADVALGTIFVSQDAIGTAVERSAVSWTGVGTANPLSATVNTTFDSNNGGFLQQVDDTTFDAFDGSEAFIARLRRGPTNDVLVYEPNTGDMKRSIRLLLRDIDARPTINTLAGKWHALVWEIQAAGAPRSGTTLPMSIVADLGSAVVQPTGAVTFKFPSRVTRTTDLGTGVWSRKAGNGGTAAAKLTIEPSDFITQLQFGDGPVTDMRVCDNGNVIAGKLVGVDRGFGVADAQVALLLMVRETTGITASALDGAYIDVLGALDLHGTDAGPPDDALGIRWRAQTATTTLSSGQRKDYPVICFTTPTPADPLGTCTETPPSEFVPFTVSPIGQFAVPSLSLSGVTGTAGDFVLYFRRDALTLGFGCALRTGSGQ
jgi:hypothetical protein